jgi:hypothetical protein
MPEREIKPKVGFNPDYTANRSRAEQSSRRFPCRCRPAARFAAIAAPEPEDEPHGYGLKYKDSWFARRVPTSRSKISSNENSPTR